VATVSGDKLLGGPQAGIAVGKAGIIRSMRANPLARALRPGKLTLAALEATLGLYLRGDAVAEVPVLRMMRTDAAALEARARAVADIVRARSGVEIAVVELESRVGGGAAPEQVVPSRGLEIRSDVRSAASVADALLQASRPIVARTTEDRVLIDLRTVLPDEDAALAEGIGEALSEHERG